MDVDAVDVNEVVRQTIESSLLRAPVKRVYPVVDQVPDRGHARAVRPGSIVGYDGPLRRPQARIEIGDRLVADVDLVIAHVHEKLLLSWLAA